MANKVCKLDLYSSSVSAISSNLVADINDTNSLITVLENFVNDSSLKADMFNKVRGKVSEYIELLKLRKALAEDLRLGVINSVSKMNSFLGDDMELDESELNAAKARLKRAQINYENITQTLKDTDKIRAIQYDPIDLSYYWNLIIEAKNKIIKLENLSSMDSGFYSTHLQEPQQSLSNYSSKVNGVDKVEIVSKLPNFKVELK